MTVDRGAYMRGIRSLLQGAGLRVGEGVAPKGSAGDLPMPYVVIYPQWSDPLGMSVGCQGTDAALRFRLVTVAITAGEAEAVTATADSAIRGQRIAVTGRSTEPIRWEHSTGAERDDDVVPPCFYVSALYSVVSTEELP